MMKRWNNFVERTNGAKGENLALMGSSNKNLSEMLYHVPELLLLFGIHLCSLSDDHCQEH
jgi:hypothetical protein